MEKPVDPQVDQLWMLEAFKLAEQGRGFVEPNPMVGCVLIQPNDHRGVLVGKGFHQRFGHAHAEVNAISNAGKAAAGSTAYVSLEPCAHQGKTGPCVEALIKARVRRVVVGMQDPFPKVAGKGISKLREAGIRVDVGICQTQAEELLAPYVKNVIQKLPWVIAKWAMTWDGKIATVSGDSQWISNEQSREQVHRLRGLVDAIMVGAETAAVDDPQLTARPSGPRIATRIVIDSQARLSVNSKLVSTAGETPVLICVGPQADASRLNQLSKEGVTVWKGDDDEPNKRLIKFLHHLNSIGMSNVLVEGGGQLLGSLFDQEQVDEVHCFIGPRIVGGQGALSPVAGNGRELISDSAKLVVQSSEMLGNDAYLIGRINHPTESSAEEHPRES